MMQHASSREATLPEIRSRSWWQKTWHEMHWQIKLYLRTPPAVFFTFAFPIVLLLVLRWRYDDALFARLGLSFAEVVVPAIASIAMVVACYAGLATEVTAAREKGILKRLRATPLPPSAYLCARILSVAGLGALAALLMLLVGVLFFGIALDALSLLLALAVLFVGGACFSALGLAVASVTPTVGAASAITNFTLLPLLFFSGAIVPDGSTPLWLQTLSSMLPLNPFAESMRSVIANVGSDWLRHLAVLLVWTLLGTLLAVRYFRWLPRRL
jgi:ABC-2 type transport system permease protein